MLRITLATLLIGSSIPVHAQDWAKARLEKSPRHHEQVMVKAGGRDITTFVVYPEAKAKRPVILLVPDHPGVTDWFQSFADEVAGMGYVALAPQIADPGQAMGDLSAVADYALKLPASNGMLFVAGIGSGGAEAFRFAAERQDLAAALVFCGAPPDKDAIAKIKGSVFGFYAANDPSVDASVPPAQAAARQAGVVFEAVTYKGVGPGFLESGDGPNADQTDKLTRGYAMERMKSVLDMVALRGY